MQDSSSSFFTPKTSTNAPIFFDLEYIGAVMETEGMTRIIRLAPDQRSYSDEIIITDTDSASGLSDALKKYNPYFLQYVDGETKITIHPKMIFGIISIAEEDELFCVLAHGQNAPKFWLMVGKDAADDILQDVLKFRG